MIEKTVRLSNLPSNLKESDILEFFQGMNDEIEDVYIHDNVALVLFREEEDVESSKMYDDQSIGECQVRVEAARVEDALFAVFEMRTIAKRLQSRQPETRAAGGDNDDLDLDNESLSQPRATQHYYVNDQLNPSESRRDSGRAEFAPP